MGLKKKLAMLAAAGAMCFGAKAQSHSDYHEPRDTRAPMTQHQKENKKSSTPVHVPAIVSGALVGIWAAGGFGKNKKR